MHTSHDDIMAFLDSIKHMCKEDVAEYQNEIYQKVLYLQLESFLTQSREQKLELQIEAMYNTNRTLQIENDKISKLLQDSKHHEQIIQKRFQNLENEFVQAQEVACKNIQMIHTQSKKSLSLMKQDNANVRDRYYNLLEKYNTECSLDQIV